MYLSKSVQGIKTLWNQEEPIGYIQYPLYEAYINGRLGS